MKVIFFINEESLGSYSETNNDSFQSITAFIQSIIVSKHLSVTQLKKRYLLFITQFVVYFAFSNKM